ncbi:MAG: hypothetical protein L0Z62_12840 [Gemmataceae bacterium]|nr:hypothetical protein [Gemmataceae bacterium]
MVFDELDRLRSLVELRELLTHYAHLGLADSEAWQDRVLDFPGCTPAELVRWHGELIAHGWLEQNTGLTPVLRAGAVPACYRITTAGHKALKRAAVTDEEEEARARAA